VHSSRLCVCRCLRDYANAQGFDPVTLTPLTFILWPVGRIPAGATASLLERTISLDNIEGLSAPIAINHRTELHSIIPGILFRFAYLWISRVVLSVVLCHLFAMFDTTAPSDAPRLSRDNRH